MEPYQYFIMPIMDDKAQVTVEAIPYTEADNAQGGKTVTIAGA